MISGGFQQIEGGQSDGITFAPLSAPKLQFLGGRRHENSVLQPKARALRHRQVCFLFTTFRAAMQSYRRRRRLLHKFCNKHSSVVCSMTEISKKNLGKKTFILNSLSNLHLKIKQCSQLHNNAKRQSLQLSTFNSQHQSHQHQMYLTD